MDPLVRAMCDAVLLPNCERYQLHLTQVIRIMPGQGAQPIHRDRWAWGARLRGLEPQLNTIWALTPFTFENGATQVVPGSTDWPDKREATPDEIGYAEMDAGSVLLYSGSVFHGGGANTDRRGPHRAEHHLRPRMAAPGGEPVPGLPAGDRPARWTPSCRT